MLVFGAGLAGLTAAYELREARCKVTVLDARARARGGVRTLRQFAGGLNAEAGETLIYVSQRHLLRYVKEFGLPLVSTAPRQSRTFFRGRWTSGLDTSVVALANEERGIVEDPQLTPQGLHSLTVPSRRAHTRQARWLVYLQGQGRAARVVCDGQPSAGADGE